ncbi:hypothetical protein, partial [Flavobacterium psychrotolerans]
MKNFTLGIKQLLDKANTTTMYFGISSSPYVKTTFFGKLMLVLLLGATPFIAMSQNSLNSGDFSTGSWGAGQAMSSSAGTSLILTKTVTTSGDKFFRFYGDGSPCGEYQPNTNGDFFTHSTVVTTPNGNCGSANAWRVNVPTTSSNVVFKTDGLNAGISQSVLFVVQGTVRTVSSVTQLPTSANVQPGQAVTVTANLSGSLSTGQGVYMRYSNDNFTTSTVVQLTGAASTYTGTIPATINLSAAAIKYYVFTSTDAGVGAGATQVTANGSNSDFYTINLDNNAGSNYSYTVATGVAVYLHNYGASLIVSSPPYTVAPGTFNANLSLSSWTNAGVTAWNGLAGNGGGTSGSLSTNTGNNTYTLTFNVASGYQLSVSSFNFWTNHSGTGPTNWAMTINGTSVGSGLTGGGATYGQTNVSNPIANLTGTITVAMSLTGGSGAGTFRLDDFTLNGTVSAIATSPPSITSFAVAAPGSGTSGYVGNVVTVTGTGFTGVSSVKVGGSGGTTVSTFTVVNDTTITFPAIEASGTIYVLNPSGNSTSAGSYTNLGYITTAGATNWNTAASWLGGAVPTANSTVTIAHALNIAAAITNTPVASVTVNTGITATVNATVAAMTVTNAITTLGTGIFTFTGAAGSVTAGSFVNGGTLSWAAAATLNISAGGTLTNNGTFTRGTGTVVVVNAATINGSSAITFNNLTITTGTATLTTVPTIDGILTINGGSVSAAPIYTSNSTLFYNVAYSRFAEWNATGIGTIGSTAGYPNNVTINTGTFDIVNGSNVARAMNGNLLVNTGATFNINALNAILTVGGNLTTTGTGAVNMGTTNKELVVIGSVSNAGTLTLSSVSLGDIYVAGSFANNGTFTHNTRAVFFNGSTATTQTISGSGLNSTGATNCFAYFINNNTNAGVTIGANVTIDGTSGDVLQLLNTGALKIGAFTLTVNGNGGIIRVTGASRIIDFTSASGILKIVGTTGTLKTVSSTSSGLLSITSSVAGGQVQVQSGGFDCGSGLTTFGTGSFLTLLSGAYVAVNSPTYSTGSTLSFRTGAAYGVGAGDKSWAIGTSGVGVPSNVEVNAASTNVQINEDRTATGVVTVTTGTITNNTNTLNISTGIAVAANALIINGGTLTNGGGTVNIGVANGGNQAIVMSSGALTLSSGTINENGNISLTGGTFTMSGGAFNIDPNSGVAGTSVASGTDIFSVTAATTAVSAGSILFNDPPFVGSGLSFVFNAAGANANWAGNTIQFGGSSGTNASTATNGFGVDTYFSTKNIQLGHVIANGGAVAGASRFVSGSTSSSKGFDVGGNLTINASSEVRTLSGGAPLRIKGNIVNNGTLTDFAGIEFNNRAAAVISANTIAQTVTGSGVFQNNTAGSTASFTNLVFNNTAVSPAITFSVGNLSVSGATTFTAGIIDVGVNNDLTYIGTATTSRTNGWVKRDGTGQMIRTFASTGSFVYAIGDGALYSGITPNFTLNSVSRTIGFKLTDAVHPQNNNPLTPADYLSRYWTMTENAAGGNYTFTLATTYNVAGDVNGTEGNIQTAAWNGTTWVQYGPGGVASPTLTSGTITQATAPTLNGLDWTGRLSSGSSYTWNGTGGDGLWGTAANWTPNGIPGSLDQITIVTAGTNLALADARTVSSATFNGNFSVTATGSLAVTGGLTYTSGTATWDCASTFTMSSSSAQTIPAFNYGNLDATGGNRTLASSGTIGICGTFTRGAGVYTITGSTVNYNGFGAQTISAGTYNNLTISNARGAATLTSPSGTIDVAGAFDVSTLSNYVASVNASSIFNFSSAGTQTVPAFFYGQLNNTGNGARTWASSGIIDINRGFTPTTALNTITGSTIRYSDTSATTWTLSSFTTNVASRQYNNLELVGGASTLWKLASGFNLGCAGNFDVSGAGTFTVATNATANTMTVDGNLTLSGSGNIIIANTATAALVNSITVTGNTSISNGLLTAIGSSSSTTDQGNLVTNDLTISGTGAINLDAASTTAFAAVTVNGNMSVTSTTANAVNFGSGTANSGNVFNLKGNLTKSGTGTFGCSGTFNAGFGFLFNKGSGTQTIDYSGAAMTVGNFTVSSGSTLQLLSNLTLGTNATASKLTVVGVLDASSFVVAPGNATNAFDLQATGTLSTANAGGISSTISGFTNANTTWAAGATFVYTGTAVNTGLSGYAAISSASAYNFTWLGNTSLTLDKSISPAVFNFTNTGLVYLGNNSITLPSTAGALTGAGFGVSKMFVTNGTGTLSRAVLTAGTGLPFTWPIGENTGTTEYSPVTVTSFASLGANGSIAFRVIDGVQPNMGSAVSYLSRYWPCTVTGFTSGYTLSNLTFNYETADIVVGPEASLKGNIYSSTSASWTELATSSAASNVLTIASGISGSFMPTTGTYDITGRIDVPTYYQSTGAGGSWATAANWQVADNPSFTGATAASTSPNNANSAGIFIRSGSPITVDSSVTADQLTVDASATLTVGTSGSLTIANGTGTDLSVASTGTLLTNAATATLIVSASATVQIDGTFREATGTPTVTVTGSITIGATATYEHNINAGTVPTCTWTSGSTCLLTGITGNAPGGLAQAFHHFTVNSPSSTGMNTTSNLQTVNGNLTLVSTGSGSLRLSSGSAYALVVGGNIDVQGSSQLDFSSGGGTSTVAVTGNLTQAGTSVINKTSTATITLTINGNYVQSAGTFDVNNGSSGGAMTVNFKGDVTMNGTVQRSNGGTYTFNFVKASGTQTLSQGTPITTAQAIIWNFGNGTTTNTVQFLTDVNVGTSGTSATTVFSNATLDFQDKVLYGTNSVFTQGATATLKMGSANGITTGASGNLQTLAASRGVVATGTFVYNGTVNQVTGNLLPATLSGTGKLTISNTGTTGNNTVTLTTNNTTTPSLNLTSGLFAPGSGQQLNMTATTGTITGTGGNCAVGTTGGVINFNGAGTIAGSSAITFNDVTINTGTIVVPTGGTIPTIGGILKINNGNVDNPPIYGAASTLFYNVTYGRFKEWDATSIGTIGTTPGYPNNVTINTGNFDVANGSTLARAMNGNLLVNTGTNFNINALNAILTVGGNLTTAGTGAVNMGTTNKELVVIGNVTNAGSLVLSSASGGDIYVGGNVSNSGTFTPNGRAVFFNGATGDQTITAAAGIIFDYVVINKATSGNVVMANAVTINQTLTLTKGLLVLGNNDVTFGASGTTASASTSSYIAVTGTGKVIKAHTGTFDYPIGANLTNYAPVTINNTGVSQTYTVGVANTTYTPAIDGANWQWSISTPGTSSSNLSFKWFTADAGANLTAAPTSGLASNYDGSIWTNYTSSTTAASPNVTTVNGITSFTNPIWTVSRPCSATTATNGSTQSTCITTGGAATLSGNT